MAMTESMLWSIGTFAVYLVVMVAIGLWAYRRTVSQSDFVLGGRRLNPWVAGLSANASDFSGWLLLGLPGAIYVSGLGEAWIAVGLACGFAGSWILLAPRLRVYTQRVTDARTGGDSDSLTLSSFLENRFNDPTRLLRGVSSLLIIVFYFFYVASGLVAMSALFDQVRTCDNHCEFCFIYQLPPGLRRSLYLKDDDYRLSFLYGNFTTLTRFTEVDLERIITEGLSPLYVSIHATDPDVRAEMLRNRRGATSLRWLRLLLDHGVKVHGQVVVCPGLNDGAGTHRVFLPVRGPLYSWCGAPSPRADPTEAGVRGFSYKPSP
jgi:hypothetical protein